MTGAGLAALLSHWRRNPLQLFTLLAGLALATALWSGVQAINAEARASYDAAADTLDEGRFARIEARDGQPFDQAAYVALRRGGWLVSPVVEGPLGEIRLIGIDPLTAPGGFGPGTPDGLGLPDLLARLYFGRAEALSAIDAPDAQKITMPDMPPGIVFTDIGPAQRLLQQDGLISRLVVAPDQPMQRADLSDLAPGLSLIAPQDGTDIGQLTGSFHLNLTAFGLLSFAVGIFIVHGAIGLAFEQRRPMLRTMRALGFPLRRLIGLMALELLILALVAGLVGVALGYGIAAALLPDVAATLRGLYGAEVSGSLQLRAEWWLSGMAIAVIGTAVAAVSAFLAIARMPLLASARPRAWAMRAGPIRRWQAGAGIALMGLAAVLAQAGSGLVAGFGLLAALLIGAALLLPLMLDLVLWGLSRLARAPIPQWFWADTRQQLPGLSLALMALLLAMAANVGVSTMVSSFRLTFTGFLDQRLSAELYVSTEDAQQAAALERYVETRVQAVLPIRWIDAEVAGQQAEVQGPRPHATYRENWQFLDGRPDAWARIEAGTGAAVNEQLARRTGLAVGDEITLAGRSFEVVGIHGDYGNPIGQVLVTEAAFEALYPQVTALRFALRLPPEEVASLRDSLHDDLGLPRGNMIDQAALKAFSLEVFDRTFTVTAALNILTLSVAGFAMLMSLLTLSALRLPQLAPVWALGLTRAAIGRIELLRAMLLAVLTTGLALPLGLALAWVLLAVVNVEAFGWRLPMFLFPGSYLQLGGFALLAAGLAALWPARRLARTPPADLLKVFSNER